MLKIAHVVPTSPRSRHRFKSTGTSIRLVELVAPSQELLALLHLSDVASEVHVLQCKYSFFAGNAPLPIPGRFVAAHFSIGREALVLTFLLWFRWRLVNLAFIGKMVGWG